VRDWRSFFFEHICFSSNCLSGRGSWAADILMTSTTLLRSNLPTCWSKDPYSMLDGNYFVQDMKWSMMDKKRDVKRVKLTKKERAWNNAASAPFLLLVRVEQSWNKVSIHQIQGARFWSQMKYHVVSYV
jgi:hypothetical protein